MEQKNLLRGIYTRSKINKRVASYAIILYLTFGTLIGMLGTFIAPPSQSYNVWGTAYEGVTPPGLMVADGSEISGWIDGVCWGTATVVTAMFDLDIDSDGWGVPSGDSVKDGGFEGDSLMFFLDYDPMDYYLNVSVLFHGFGLQTVLLICERTLSTDTEQTACQLT